MTDSVLPLRSEQCPLLPSQSRDELVQKFNKIAELFEHCRAACEERASTQLQEAHLKLQHVRKELARSSYLVGFLGPFQSGKSRTFNHVLGAHADEQPARVGRGSPTTAVVTRLKRAEGDEHSASLVFLSQNDYRQKREFLIQRSGLQSADCADGRILEEVHHILANWKGTRTWRDAAGEEFPVRKRDVQYLSLMLQSYRKYSDYVRSEPYCMDIPFDERAEYLQHPPDPWERQPPTYAPLLSYAELRYATDAIPPTLEMIDLPGYDADCSVDAFVTDDFLKSLQGALLFCRATDFDGVLENITSKLRRLLGHDISGRVWVVFTRCDDINISATDQQQTCDPTFEHMANYLDRIGVPNSNVLFVTNELEEFRRRFANERLADVTKAAIRSVQSQWETLADTWEKLYEDGGISALRQLIVDRVSVELGHAIARRAFQELERLRRDLLHFGEIVTAKVLSKTYPKEIAHWRAQILGCKKEILLPHTILSLARTITDALLEELEQLHIREDVIDYIIERKGNDGLHEEFTSHCRALEAELSERMRAEWVDNAYQPVLTAVQEYEGQGKRITLSSSEETVSTLLSLWRDEDRTLRWLNDVLPSFTANDPFEGLYKNSDPLFRAADYVTVMGKKCRVVARQTAIALLRRVDQRLGDLLNELSTLSSRAGTATFKTEETQKRWENIRRSCIDDWDNTTDTTV